MAEKQGGRFWVTFLTGFIIIVISSCIALWLTGYTYILKTLIYQYPDIDDLNIFHSRMIADKEGKPWPLSVEYNKTKPPANLESSLNSFETVSFVVIKNDSLIYEQYNDGY